MNDHVWEFKYESTFPGEAGAILGDIFGCKVCQARKSEWDDGVVIFDIIHRDLLNYFFRFEKYDTIKYPSCAQICMEDIMQ